MTDNPPTDNPPKDRHQVTVHYWAAARDAAGVAADECLAATLAEALTWAGATRGERLRTVLARCSFIVDGDPVGRRDPMSVVLRPESVIEVLPPFAGG
jgi:molybdopterin converting factor small subunit